VRLRLPPLGSFLFLLSLVLLLVLVGGELFSVVSSSSVDGAANALDGAANALDGAAAVALDGPAAAAADEEEEEEEEE